MKKLVFLLAVGSLCLPACQPDNTYKITGSIQSLHEGDSVFLRKTKDGQRQQTGTVVTNGTFEFSGTTDTTEVCSIVYLQNNQYENITLFLERGDIHVNYSQEGGRQIGGTLHNDILNEYNIQSDSLFGVMRETYMGVLMATDGEKRKELNEKLKKEEEFSKAMYADMLKKNIGNPVGLYFLTKNYLKMEVPLMKELLALMPQKYQNLPSVLTIKKQMEADKKAVIGETFTDFEMQTPEGKTLKVSALIRQNQYTLIDFWASWCGPCCAEMPNVAKAYKAYKGKGFGVVGISLDQSKEAWEEAIRDLKLSWTHLSDLKGGRSDIARMYCARGIPATYLVDRNGVIVAKNLRGDAISKKLEELLK